MIKVRLPDGRSVKVDTEDESVARQKAQVFYDNNPMPVERGAQLGEEDVSAAGEIARGVGAGLVGGVEGLSSLPEQITKQNSPNDGSYNLFGASGNSDGYLAFNYGQTSSLDNPMLKPPTTCTIKPEVGKLFIFPIWLQHMVYPFKGEGERRTIAANLCAWHKDNADNESVINKMYKE